MMNVSQESPDDSPDVTDDFTFKRAVVKLPELDPSKISAAEIVKAISKYIHPKKIKSVMFDLHVQCYLVFVADIESVCLLIKKELVICQYVTRAVFLLDCYIIDGVYPHVTDDILREIFECFGRIYTIRKIYLLPNSSKYAHVLSSKREIDFVLPTDQTKIEIPDNISNPLYNFKVIKYCFGCFTEGHSILDCSDVDDFVLSLPDVSSELICKDDNDKKIKTLPNADDDLHDNDNGSSANDCTELEKEYKRRSRKRKRRRRIVKLKST
ncbi:uncharacterized protein LOC118181674 [Stegodyphus dumicola]|uniref:uncharacterized protein LOC118181674 n=1 Tax=Stegodyphus dumicola TaxID=202533 RepID=UPI0015B2E609|nr:uncharacterized protein LOC118181674 [Stegodyphus dumicola]